MHPIHSHNLDFFSHDLRRNTPVDGATFYRIYRGTKTGSDYAVEIDTTTETSYADERGAAGKTYYYSVKAVSASCESDFSAFVAGKR